MSVNTRLAPSTAHSHAPHRRPPAARPHSHEILVTSPTGQVRILAHHQLLEDPALRESLAHLRKDLRYYALVHDTLEALADGSRPRYLYLALQDAAGKPLAIQPAFVLDQDLLAGAPRPVRSVLAAARKLLPNLLKLRTLMVGCAAGEGHLPASPDASPESLARALHEVLLPAARRLGAKMVVLKEFPAEYRPALAVFSNDGYARVPSFPMVRLNIDFSSFEDYMAKTLSSASRKNLRRKFRHTAAADPITLEVVSDITPHLAEVYPLYLNVFARASLQFEKLTPDFFRRLGTDLHDRARFFIWRQNGKAIAVSLCILDGENLYDEYLGLDYDVAHDLNLYHYTFRDIVQWGIEHGFRWYYSTALSYEPKLHLKCDLAPLDLYVAHTNRFANFFLKRLLPWLEPTRHDKVLPRFPNADDLWGPRPNPKSQL